MGFGSSHSLLLGPLPYLLCASIFACMKSSPDVPPRPVVCRIMLRRTVYVYVCCCACKLGKKAKTKGKKPAAPKPKKDAPGAAGLKPTVGTQFKDQLHNLMDMIRWVGGGADDR